MHKFLVRTALFMLIVFLGFACIVVVMFVVPRWRRPPDQLPAGYSKNFDSCDILICGDSRADEQLDPAIFYKTTGLNTQNIAAPSWDIYSVSKCLKEANVSNKLLVISSAFFQVNDGAVDYGYFGIDSYARLSFGDRVKLYWRRPKDFFYMQADLFDRSVYRSPLMLAIGNDKRRINLDYNPQACANFAVDEGWFSRHPWYQDVHIEGIKRKLMIEGLKNLSELNNCRVFIYNGPDCTDFYKKGAALGVIKWEEGFDAFMVKECSRYNFSYYSFLGDTTLRDNSLYVNAQHLCEEGAEKFSARVCLLLASRGLIKPEVKTGAAEARQ